ncbi:ATP-dependent endonuclease [Ideonella sp. B508-1]|uniref:ATP-dependent nuclease n=1 Tax=Ideonella sp. B508-1 TaxID=137716 RepID=UPI0019007199|nr:AAA family ATPase [Ideonella sp. B508-1]
MDSKISRGTALALLAGAIGCVQRRRLRLVERIARSIHGEAIRRATGPAPVPAKTAKGADWRQLAALEIRDFKAIHATTVQLGPVTILVGPNGSGKSSVLQAAHWAARAASYIKPKNTKEVISFDRLDYLPSSQPLRTAHFADLGSGGSTTHTSVRFIGTVGEGEEYAATVKIWAARNRGAISAHIEGGAAVTPFKQRATFITAYIPGLAGLAERETILAQPQMRRHAASGDAGGVLRNIIYNISVRQQGELEGEGAKRLARLNELVQKIHPGVTISVGFDEREDIHINANFSNAADPSTLRPLEDLATGVLQVVQIFAYLVLFRPKLLLVDEPDAHLHPDKQERLIEALEDASQEFSTQIIVTTHSQHVVRAASPTTKLVWMRDGDVVTDDESKIRHLMGWGGLDKKVLFFVEDEDAEPVRQLLRQWPSLMRQVSLCRCFGIDNLPRHPMIRGLIEENDLDLRILLHRDRDFMTSVEAKKWSTQFSTKRTWTWVTEPVDVEGYFCNPEYIAASCGISLADAHDVLNTALTRIQSARKTFLEKRTLITRQLYPPSGGSPDSEAMWESEGGQRVATVLGKSLHKAVKQVLHERKVYAHALGNFEIPASFELASDLKMILELALA